MQTTDNQTTTTTAVATMAALTEAAEFLMCAVRAMAWGADVGSDEVRKPVEWALSKVADAGCAPSQDNFSEFSPSSR